MNFDLDDAHIALREAVRRFCDNECPPPLRGAPWNAEEARAHRAGLASLGLTGLLFDADCGGSGQGAVELSVVARELGRALAGGSFIAEVAVAGRLLARRADAGQRARWLGPLVAGDLRVAAAIEEDGMRHRVARTALTATREGGFWRLSGQKSLVIGGDIAQAFVVLARSAGLPGEDEGLSLFMVDADAAGLAVRAHDTLEGRRAARLRFDAVRVDDGARLGAPDGALGDIEEALDTANAALVAEAGGAMEALIDLVAEHLRTRTQFGAPLAKFQVLQHRVADMVIATEQIHSMACAAAMAVDAGDATQRRRIVSAAKALAARWGREAALAAIQLHGAMGMTEECTVGRYAKRLMVIGQLFGDQAHHLDRLRDASAHCEAHLARPYPETRETA